MNDKLRTKVTCIQGRYHVRLIENDLLINEMACGLKRDISFCCREMLRWYDKLGGTARIASSSRDRLKNDVLPAGKIWFEKDLRPKYIGYKV